VVSKDIHELGNFGIIENKWGGGKKKERRYLRKKKKIKGRVTKGEDP